MAQGDGGQVEWLDALVQNVRQLHELILETSGGMHGEHTSSLSAACARPFQSAFGEDIYQTPFERAAALFHGIICDHVFADGNKRTATVATIDFLGASGGISQGANISLQVQMLGAVALLTASEGASVEFITHWLRRIFDESLLAPVE